jgi:hypothetical protein
VAAARPLHPGPEQLATIHTREGLEPCAPEQALDAAPAAIVASFDLPLPGVSLLEIET